MSDEEQAEKLNTIYEHIWSAHGGGVYAQLDQSLHPRPPEMLYDFVAALAPIAGAHALDVGCGRGNHTCALAQRFQLNVAGIDPIESNLTLARAAAAQQGLTGRVNFLRGSMARIPSATTAFDLVWCRDMLVHVPDAREGFRECYRVLKTGGYMLIFTTYATARMEPQEAARIYEALGIVAANMSATYVEDCMQAAGLQIVACETLGSELVQYYEERDGRCSRELMRLARMLQAREQFVAALGAARYEVTLALYHWLTYQLLGKLSSAIYTLRKADSA